MNQNYEFLGSGFKLQNGFRNVHQDFISLIIFLVFIRYILSMLQLYFYGYLRARGNAQSYATFTETKHEYVKSVVWNVAQQLILTCYTTDVLPMLLLEGKKHLKC